MPVAAPTVPSTAEAIDFLDDLRRELRFTDLLDAHVKEPLKFVVCGTDAPKQQHNPSKGTACWSFRGANPGTHLIHFCLRLFGKLLPEADWRGYLTAYAHHELLHACVTPRDLRSAKERLDVVGVPFGEYNLFEDARIEAIGRKDFGFPLDWTNYETPGVAATPRAYFFNLVQCAGRDDPALVEPAVAGEPWITRVRDYYYAKAIGAHDFPAMLALLKEWVEEFPSPPSGGATASGLPTDLELSLSITDEDFEVLCAEGPDKASEIAGSGGPGQGEIKSVNLGEDADNDVLAPAPVRTVNNELATRAANRLRGLLEPARRRERSALASKRISARAFQVGRPDFYRRTVDAVKSRAVKVAFFIDCSGSMGSSGPDGVTAIDGGIALAMGLNQLANRGLVGGHIILHKGNGGKALCSAYALPVPDGFFERVPNDGGWEALEPAFRRTSDLTRAADYVFCYTDGQICDEPLNVPALAARGVHPVGLYCGAADAGENLKKWFSQVIVRPSVLDLLEALIAKVDFRKTRRGR